MQTILKWTLISIAIPLIVKIGYNPEPSTRYHAPLYPKTVKPSWAWKLATTPEDAHNFINGLEPYDTPHAVGSISATTQGFYIFYRTDIPGVSDWGWKLAPTPEDAHAFLNGVGDYNSSPKDQAEAAYRDSGIYIFYRGASPKAKWGWKRATEIDDMHRFINGQKPYKIPKSATLTAWNAHDIIAFYRDDKVGSPKWGWKLATTPDNALNFLNGTGAYSVPVKQAQVFNTSDSEFYIFYRK